MSNAKTSATDEQALMRAPSITNTLRAADDVSQTLSRRRDLRVVHSASVVLPESTDRDHARAPGDGDADLRAAVRFAVWHRAVAAARLAREDFRRGGDWRRRLRLHRARRVHRCGALLAAPLGISRGSVAHRSC